MCSHRTFRRKCNDLDSLIVVGGRTTGWHIWDETLAAASSEWHGEPTPSDAPAICFYTSGTTKDPKAVLHTHAYTYAHRYTGQYWRSTYGRTIYFRTKNAGPSSRRS